MSSFQIIPVVDLQRGEVVHARRGARHSYRAVESLLCPGSDPATIVAALLDLYPFTTLYVADLDALAGRAAQAPLVAALLRRWPTLNVWADSGVHPAYSGPVREFGGRLRSVYGSESQLARGAFAALTPADLEAAVLSLDFRLGAALGRHPEHSAAGTPGDVIVMDLDRVGSGLGPDWGRLATLIRHWSPARVHAAGGVRTPDDLMRLLDMGAAGALVATALHAGGLDAAAVRSVQQRATAPP
ncbi:MAG: hypothetical protein IT495_03620 [Gammaproteobacteria bacterium]|nr:hypothetical protein [Gammaproteobacteria bacterium]